MAAKVFIAVPNMGWLHTGLVERLIPWLRDWDTILYTPSGLRPIPFARNTCVRAFLHSPASHLWFIDADTVPPAETLELFLRANVVAISGVVHQMKVDDDGIQKPVPMVMQRNGNGDLKAAYGEGVELIDACGSGCVLYERQVFERLEFPWYEERPWGDVRGSDFILCEKLADVGIPLHAHFDVVCRHRKEMEF